MKICLKCNKEKGLSEFNKSKGWKDGYRSDCKECRYGHKVRVANYNFESKVCLCCFEDKVIDLFPYIDRDKKLKHSYCKKCKNRKRQIKRNTTFIDGIKLSRILKIKQKYKLSMESYNDMLDNQNGLCKICNNKFDYDLHIDHCHTTGKVRGLLCRDCNQGLGNFKDNTDLMLSGIKYLQDSRL
jgi:hypothetical protein